MRAAQERWPKNLKEQEDLCNENGQFIPRKELKDKKCLPDVILVILPRLCVILKL